MNKLLLLFFTLIASIAMGQQTFYDVDYGNNLDDWKTYAKVVIHRSESQIIIDHYLKVDDELYMRHTYDIISVPSYENYEYLVRLQPLKHTTYRIIPDSDYLQFFKSGSGNKVFHYYSSKGIGNSINK